MSTTSHEDKTVLVEDFDLNMICNFFRVLDRQGPGSEEATLKALGFIEHLPSRPKIADIGCGAGGQTVTLARHTKGDIVAVDFLPGMIEELDKRIRQHRFGKRVTGLIGSMDDLPFHEGELDLMWAEGSIYHMGFENGLKAWRRFLKPGGYVAVTEMTWLTTERPAEIERYLNENCPEMDTTAGKLKVLEEAGYSPVATFVLPESCWIDTYYRPVVKLYDAFLEAENHSDAATLFVERIKEEVAMYERYRSYFGYVFYIGRRMF